MICWSGDPKSKTEVCLVTGALEHAKDVSVLHLRLEHEDDIQVGTIFSFINIRARRVEGDVQGASSRQHLHLSEEARVARASVNPTLQENFFFPLQTDCVLRSITRLQCHLKI